jgi:hypothetical protein
MDDISPVLIAHSDDIQANAVLKVLATLPGMSDFETYCWRDQDELCQWFARSGRTPNSCIAVLTGASMTKPGTFTLAGSRRGRALTRIPWQRGWVGHLGIIEWWFQIVYVSPKSTPTHGARGMAEQLASWLRT